MGSLCSRRSASKSEPSSEQWYASQTALPVFSLVAGSAMTRIALAIESISISVQHDRLVIEARQCFGETALTAMSDAVRSGHMPTINAMSAIGLVTIPRMMTGQLLANADPLRAAKYQMLLMFLIAGVSVLGIIGTVYKIASRLTNDRHRVRLDRLTRSAPH
ncbi:MAG: ABC transporter permease [Pseudomonadota bacterium]